MKDVPPSATSAPLSSAAPSKTPTTISRDETKSLLSGTTDSTKQAASGVTALQASAIDSNQSTSSSKAAFSAKTADVKPSGTTTPVSTEAASVPTTKTAEQPAPTTADRKLYSEFVVTPPYFNPQSPLK